MADLTPFAFALLGEFSVQETTLSCGHLMDRFPAGDAVSAWFDGLQSLLDAGFVERVALPDQYEYRITYAGLRYARAHVIAPRRAIA